jgi:hypothetical protein
MTKAEQREAAEVLKRVVERIDQGEVEAPAWYRERLVGAVIALNSDRRSELVIDDDVAVRDRLQFGS